MPDCPTLLNYFVESCFDPDTFCDIKKTADDTVETYSQREIEFDEVKLLFMPDKTVLICDLYSDAKDVVETATLLEALKSRLN